MTGGAKYLETVCPKFLFVHPTDPDTAGHRAGWMTPKYARAVLDADRAVNRLITLATDTFGQGTFSVIVTADHGGHETRHGSEDPRDVTIPWIAWGRGVKPGPIESSVRTMDTAATVLWLLAIDRPHDWEGQPVADAFSSSAAGG